jgi:hypothetical protein
MFFSGGPFTRTSFLSLDTKTCPAVEGQTYIYGESKAKFQPIFITKASKPDTRNLIALKLIHFMSSVALVRERPPPVGEVSANFFG